MTSPVLPEIAVEDIDWAAAILGLTDLDAPRREFLKATDTLDVSACPGSGKTTLVVAKLAILARKWTHRTRGVCVLSHTNVARQEIQDRLGATAVGTRLLGYPHFIDTIHTFANRFFALPYLAAIGVSAPTIDDEIAQAVRYSVLPETERFTLSSFLERKHISLSDLTFNDSNITPVAGARDFPAGSHTNSYKIAEKILQTSLAQGYLKYEEMFVWAEALLQDYPDIASAITHRFPMVMIDEMQDTSDRQAALLRQVFERTQTNCVIQRVGDPNQQIFKTGAEENKADPFPDAERTVTITSSRRFGQTVANIADPFAVTPIEGTGLVGAGPQRELLPGQAAPPIAIIFPDNDCSGVLQAFGEHVADHLPDDIIAKGGVFAVGEVHQDADDVSLDHAHHPKTVPHYWPAYERARTKAKFYPADLLGYLREARRSANVTGSSFEAVNLIAEGLIRYADIIGEKHADLRRMRKHRAVRTLLTDTSTDFVSAYDGLVQAALGRDELINEQAWQTHCQTIETIGVALAVNSNLEMGRNFLAWSDDKSAANTSEHDVRHDPNICIVSHRERIIPVRLSTVHAVKGQTHAATLLLNTYRFSHSSEQILPFLAGEARPAKLGSRIQERFRRTFVALTRATHLVGVALRTSSMGDKAAREARVAALEQNGWVVKSL